MYGEDKVMRDKIIELISQVQYMGGLEVKLADYLISKGVTILPEGAIILTRAEIDALNKYEEMRKNEAN
jgi:hypothetical protein